MPGKRPSEFGRIHLIGVSGAGMLPLSLCLKRAGAKVSGEDDRMTSEAKEALERYEIPILLASAIKENEALVVYSSAIAESHPSRVESSRRGWKQIPRGSCLADIVKGKRLIAVAGSHGKTSTTGILIDLFESIGEEPSYAIGGHFASEKDPGRWTESDWMIIELDESDGTIEEFSPEISIILNADHDHHSKYATETEYLDIFRRLGRRTTGQVALNEVLRDSVGEQLARDRVVFPKIEKSEPAVSNQLGDFSRNNQQMALAAMEAAGLKKPNLTRVRFTPIKRRQSCLYFSPTLNVIEDYAHHPVEIAAILDALATVFSRKTIAVFQPHRYSRTLSLKGELAAALSRFDHVYLLEVYEASENPIEGGSGRDLFDACKNRFEHCEFHPDEDGLLRALESKIVGEDPMNVVFLGAGRTDILASQFVRNLVSKDLRWGTLYSEIARVLDYGSKIRSQEPLSNKTTLRLGGTAELYFEPASEPELAAALRVCHESGIPVYPLGRGSNLIVPDSGVSGLVIRLSHPHWRRFEILSEGEIRVGAGMRIKELCGVACREGLEGFEFLEGIPGSVGGALRMNAGAMGGWMFDVVKSVRFAHLDGTLVEANASELSVGYRHCRELKGAIALDAVLVASSVGQKEVELRKAIDVYQSKRKESQPREPSAGCIFKNPEGASAGQLIDELGLKGTAIGGAEISPVHGNFIVNRGGATSEDVIELVRLVRRVAKSRRSIDLEPEALLYGSDWKDVLT